MPVDTADYYYPESGCLVDFLQFGVKKLLALPVNDPSTLDFSSQSYPFDRWATATPLIWEI